MLVAISGWPGCFPAWLWNRVGYINFSSILAKLLVIPTNGVACHSG